MTAVLAAAVRAVLVLACLAAAVYTAYVPPGTRRVAWIVLVAVMVGCATLAWLALQPKGDGDG